MDKYQCEWMGEWGEDRQCGEWANRMAYDESSHAIGAFCEKHADHLVEFGDGVYAKVLVSD